jgi:hypothetical protein
MCFTSWRDFTEEFASMFCPENDVMFHINLTSEPLIMRQSSLRYAVCRRLFHQERLPPPSLQIVITAAAVYVTPAVTAILNIAVAFTVIATTASIIAVTAAAVTVVCRHRRHYHRCRRCSEWCPSAFNSFELPSWMLYQDVQLLWDSGLGRGESGYSL